MRLTGNALLVIWVLWLLIEGIVAGGIAVRQYQLWRGAERGNRLPSLLVFLLMAGWSLGGFVWLAALIALGSVRLPQTYTVLMLVARSCGSMPVWLWLGMLAGGVKEGQLRRTTVWALSWFTRVKRLNRWRESLQAIELDITLHPVASGDQPPEFWRREFREAVRDELDIYFGHKREE